MWRKTCWGCPHTGPLQDQAPPARRQAGPAVQAVQAQGGADALPEAWSGRKQPVLGSHTEHGNPEQQERAEAER